MARRLGQQVGAVEGTDVGRSGREDEFHQMVHLDHLGHHTGECRVVLQGTIRGMVRRSKLRTKWGFVWGPN